MPQTQIGAYIKNICIKNKQQATNQQHTAIIHLKNAQVYDLRELHWEKCPPQLQLQLQQPEPTDARIPKN